MELYNYYSLDECKNFKPVKKRLNQLEGDGKIAYKVDGEILKLEDLDLDENEVIEVSELLDKHDVFPYPDYEDSDDEDEYDDYYDDYDEEDY